MKLLSFALASFPAISVAFGDVEGRRALLVIDVQDCFLETSTTLPVADSLQILPVLNELRVGEYADYFDLFVRSQDFHPQNHISFGPTHGLYGFYNYPSGIKVACTTEVGDDPDEWGCCPMLNEEYCPDGQDDCPVASDLSDPGQNPACTFCLPEGAESSYVNPSCKVVDQAMWPIHCTDPLEGGDAGFPEGLVERDDDIILQKGTLQALDGYSAFQDNAFFSLTGGTAAGYTFELDALLKSEGITELYVAGLATDFCVAWSAKDGAALGYETFMIDDASAGIAEETVLMEYELMEAAGVTLLDTFGGDPLEYRRHLQQQNDRVMERSGVKKISTSHIREAIARRQ